MTASTGVILATDGDFKCRRVEHQGADRTDRGKAATAASTLTTLGFGQGNYNEAMMEQIANHGNGNYFLHRQRVWRPKRCWVEEMSSTLFTIAKDVKIQLNSTPP